MTLNNVISELTNLLGDGVDGNTEIIMFAEIDNATAIQYDRIDVSKNGDFLQFFMRFN